MSNFKFDLDERIYAKKFLHEILDLLTNPNLIDFIITVLDNKNNLYFSTLCHLILKEIINNF